MGKLSSTEPGWKKIKIVIKLTGRYLKLPQIYLGRTYCDAPVCASLYVCLWTHYLSILMFLYVPAWMCVCEQIISVFWCSYICACLNVCLGTNYLSVLMFLYVPVWLCVCEYISVFWCSYVCLSECGAVNKLFQCYDVPVCVSVSMCVCKQIISPLRRSWMCLSECWAVNRKYRWSSMLRCACLASVRRNFIREKKLNNYWWVKCNFSWTLKTDVITLIVKHYFQITIFWSIREVAQNVVAQQTSATCHRCKGIRISNCQCRCPTWVHFKTSYVSFKTSYVSNIYHMNDIVEISSDSSFFVQNTYVSASACLQQNNLKGVYSSLPHADNHTLTKMSSLWI